ncbi:MAG: MarR family transcriptional regulator [Lentisphaeria bacterium]|nr:MarR family transcriptional regulator [Lentisphaeria bacterium]
MKGLTEKQRNILGFIEDFMEVNMMAPTVYEIAEHFGIKTSTVFAHIRSLQKKNYLTRSSKARSISLKHPHKKNRRPAGLRSVPLFNSPEDAGTARSKNSEIFYDSSMLRNARDLKKLFAVRIGTKMGDFGMLDGDIAILKRSPESLRNGDIVLMKIDGTSQLRSCHEVEPGIMEFISGDHEKSVRSTRDGNLPVEGVVVGLQRSM